MTYKEKLLDPRWQRKRLDILKRDDFCCRLCDDYNETLHVHHLKYTTNNPWDIDDESLITYCKICHELVEKNKEYTPIKTLKVRINDYTDKIFFIYEEMDGACDAWVAVYYHSNRNLKLSVRILWDSIKWITGQIELFKEIKEVCNGKI